MQGSHTQWKSCERTASAQGQTSVPLRCTLLERLRRECVRITHCWLADCLLVSHWLWSQCRCFYVKLLWKVSLSSYFVCLFCKTIMAFSDNVLLRHLVWILHSQMCLFYAIFFGNEQDLWRAKIKKWSVLQAWLLLLHIFSQSSPLLTLKTSL